MKLQFYKKGLPVKTIRRLIILAVVFVASLVFFEVLLNYEPENKSFDMSKPSLPVVNMNYLDGCSTRLHGYVNQMDPTFMRDAIVPLDEARNIFIEVDDYGFEIDSVSYEVRSLDTQRKISSNDIVCEKDNGRLAGSAQIENLIEAGEEYLLIIKVNGQGQEVNYYTRIMQPKNAYVAECVDFAMNFHNTALSENPSEIASFIETDAYADNSNLYHVDIKNSLDAIAYGTFDGEPLGDPKITITDINSTFTSMTFYYQMSRKEGRTTEYYNVSEYFRIRYTADRMYLLDYSRDMEQLLNEDSIKIEANIVNIGVTSQDVQYLSNETGTVVAFVQSGELYLYDQLNRQLKKIFSFVGEDATDPRAVYNQHKIMILNIDESATMDYVVYGYMNAGEHEGECGINLYHYDSITGESTEQVFISSSNSYQILNANFSQLLYETADNEFYILVGGTLLQMNLSELRTTELMTNLVLGQYAVSDSGRYFVWMDNKEASDKLHVMDMETGNSYDIAGGSNELLKPMAFMDEHLIYGMVYKDQITNDGAGTNIYPMHKLVISEITGGRERILKEYQKGGFYVTGLNIESYTIYLDRVTINEEGTIVQAAMDTIKNSAGEQNKAVPVSTVMDEVKGRCVVMTMSELGKKDFSTRVKYEAAGMIFANATRDVNVSTTSDQTQYFVYVGSVVTLATDRLKDAIDAADESMGIVIDNNQQYIWKRGRKSYQNAFTGMAVGSGDEEASKSAKALSAILVHQGQNVQVHQLLESGDTPISIVQRALKDVTVLDLTGASLSQVLYYVNVGCPVYARTGEDEAVVIIGYDASTVIFFDPAKNGNTRMSMEDAKNYFENSGNVFISFVK